VDTEPPGDADRAELAPAGRTDEPRTVQARTTTSPERYSVPYAAIRQAMATEGRRAEETWPLQTFGGALVLSEFERTGEDYFAGHLGAFWAPPFHSGTAVGAPPESGFHTGLMFRDEATRETWYEGQDGMRTAATWHPHALDVENVYPGSKALSVLGRKLAIPDQRGFALHLDVTNLAPLGRRLRVLVLANVPHLSRHDGRAGDHGWNWTVKGAQPTPMNASRRADPRTVLVSSPQHRAAMLLGLANTPESWQVGSAREIVAAFRASGRLANTNTRADVRADGISVGFVLDLGTLGDRQVSTVTLLGYVGEDEREVEQLWSQRPSDPVGTAREAFRRSLEELFSKGLPALETKDPTLDALYRNSALQYLLNRWTTDRHYNADAPARFIGFGNFRANAVASFPWTQGTEQFLAQADPVQWRMQLLRHVATVHDSIYAGRSCRTYAVIGNPLCDTTYSFSRLSLVRAVYKYVSVTSDSAFLSEQVRGKSVLWMLADSVNRLDVEADGPRGDRAAGAGKLHDFGVDVQLFEHNLNGCALGGNYTGHVPSPNAERYMAHAMLAEMYQRLGMPSPAAAHDDLAARNRSALDGLWSPSEGWFRTVSLYHANGTRRGAPLEHTFWFQPVFHTLGYRGLLRPGQREQVLGRKSMFEGPYGFYSLAPSRHGAGCPARPDWHGPGLYSGNVGMFLADLFFDDPEYAYARLSPEPEGGRQLGYAYLAGTPIWAQSFRAERPKLEPIRSWYLEGVSVAQALVVGMMGLDPRPNETWLRPRIPDRLAAKGPVRFTNAAVQGHLWSVMRTPGAALDDIEIVANHRGNPMQHFRFGWEGRRGARVTVANLRADAPLDVTVDGVRVSAVSPGAGRLTFTLAAGARGLVRIERRPG
jgi:hypothetical protein